MILVKTRVLSSQLVIAWLLLVAALCSFLENTAAYQPEFAEPIVNISVPLGRDATFRCLVHHLGGYRVGWVKADTKAIQAIHDHVITHNPRVSVSHNDHITWNLHIKNVQEEDGGQYMCQINTDPMKSQVGYLDVAVPPDFIPKDTSGDVMVPEGGTVKLTCRARGHPDPHVQWRREDGHDIVIKEPTGLKTSVSSYQGEVLILWKISRTEMGAYMCIASNGVPPTVSKRIMVNVHFHPVIHVPNQLVGAPLGTDVTLECNVEAYPKSINYWVRDTGEMVISSSKFDVQVSSKSPFHVKMSVIVRNLQREDAGSYRCIAKNSLGEVESNIRLYEIPGPTKGFSLSIDEEDYNEQIGSAEKDQEEDNISNNLEKSTSQHSTVETPSRANYVDNQNVAIIDEPNSSSSSSSRFSGRVMARSIGYFILTVGFFDVIAPVIAVLFSSIIATTI
ncbi:lachesin-like isoform X1 [Diorhabda sublineata]|uniref:lachesin-like isoform X1 n=1 Tax=Diorhabda sublineata TaxID=1163346 RepID=UPI0024E14ADF|nr:lachesin-like isoform X1 [Diorhabda sublineata]XP_056637031.1 lachesin-like isoform X1 [Diorhabda sublineata]XP_056637032.1 lachesin-like isoform X1 [Diorhabda sublineata]XP_056637033.1 lachesin-like isoform X1 [Diorhabda sublineata]